MSKWYVLHYVKWIMRICNKFNWKLIIHVAVLATGKEANRSKREDREGHYLPMWIVVGILLGKQRVDKMYFNFIQKEY